jgi:hypothetical protein
MEESARDLQQFVVHAAAAGTGLEQRQGLENGFINTQGITLCKIRKTKATKLVSLVS